MPFPPNLLLEGEEVAIDMRPHWWQLVAPTILLSIVLVATVASYWVGNWYGKVLSYLLLATLVFALINVGVTYLRWNSTSFVVTNERIIYRHGIVAKSAKEIPLDRVENIAFDQSVFERIIGSGNLTIESAGESGRETFINMRRPNVIHNEVYRQVELMQQRDAARQASVMGQAASTANITESVPAQIAQLDELRQRGLLSEAEFQQKKRDLLDRM